MKNVVAFARHKFGSMAAYQHYISYDGGKESVQTILKTLDE
jgi:hypothetical protein